MTVSSMLYNSSFALAVASLSAISGLVLVQTHQVPMAMGAMAVCVLSCVWLFLCERRLQKSLRQMTESCAKVAKGDYESRVMLAHEGNPSLVALGNAVNCVIDNADAYLRESVAMFEHAAEEKFYRKILTTGMVGYLETGAVVLNAAVDKVRANISKRMCVAAKDLEDTVGNIVKKLTESANNMASTAEQMKRASTQAAEISSIVSAAAVEASSNVQTVAAATEELTSSSSEIARQISSVAEEANISAHSAEETRKMVQNLNTLANSVGDVVNTIRDIADQTNLLALNATIEAARAGESGKGFAVVADEVKKLANETASRTGEIDERVKNIQEAIRLSAESMEKIIQNVNNINAATASVASAVEEQNSATAEIGRNLVDASAGTQQVTQSIGQVQQKTEETGRAVEMVFVASNDLMSQSGSLKTELDKFVANIRAI